MRALACLFVLALASLICSTASAQDAKGWLGADVQDVTKAEADKLGWDTPRVAKLGVVASGSPADKAGLKTGDIIDRYRRRRGGGQLGIREDDCREIPWLRNTPARACRAAASAASA